jgi:hypothetical protein
VRASPAWSRAERFCRRWSDPATPLHQCIESLWLEFDLDGHGSDLQPRFFADLAPPARHRLRGTECERLVCDVHSALAERPLAPGTRRLVSRCLESAPPGASLLSIGLPHDDGGERLRLCFVGFADVQIDPYLRTVGWNPARRVADVTLACLASMAGAFHRPGAAITMLHVDIERDAIGSRAGLELAFARRPQLAARVAERDALDRLGFLLGCDPARCDALLAWPGRSRITLPHELWPSVIVRRLNHVKVVVDSTGGPHDAKAYLCAYRPTLRARAATLPASARPWSPASTQ